MTKQIFIAALLAAAFSATPALARIGHGYTARSTHMFAGPQASYPQVRRLPFHTEVTIYGCLRDWSWCDVSHRTDRGWVLGSDIAIGTQGRLRPMSPELGLAVLPFIIGTYWDTYYRNRPFYSQRSDFYSQRPDRGQQYQGLRQPASACCIVTATVQHRTTVSDQCGPPPPRGSPCQARHWGTPRWLRHSSAGLLRPRMTCPHMTCNAKAYRNPCVPVHRASATALRTATGSTATGSTATGSTAIRCPTPHHNTKIRQKFKGIAAKVDFAPTSILERC